MGSFFGGAIAIPPKMTFRISRFMASLVQQGSRACRAKGFGFMPDFCKHIVQNLPSVSVRVY